jgi:polysaccharide biosynthesis PFTS motif protein
VTTTSWSWPEKPELAVAAARGIRSIIWAYSSNSLTFASERAFRDAGVSRSVVIADEFWVWNRAYAQWLETRRVETTGHTYTTPIVGPLMCGDASLLDLDPADARERLGLPRGGFCIGVFDVPPNNDEWRERFGGGPPMIDMETYVEFWNLVEHVVTRVPGAYALVKLKRELGHAFKEFPEFLRDFVDEKGEHARAGRLYRVDVNVDPYLPIAACDFAVGLAYTSPVLAARTAGKPGYYLDAFRRANFPSNADFKPITLNTEEELLAAVLRARNEPRAPLVPAPDVTPPPAVVPLARAPAAAVNAAAARPVPQRRGMSPA